MKKVINKYVLINFFIAVLIFKSFNIHALPNFYDDEAANVLAENIVNEMTDEELLSQIFMFGWKGEEPDKLLIDWITKRGLGNVKVFGWNTKDSVKLGKAIHLLQKKAALGRFGIPLFVATDQEGGLVRHVKGLALHTPGNLALGATRLPYDAYKTGYYISMELRALGINLNFAPTVDLYTNYGSSVIGIRSFGESPIPTAKLAVAFMKGAKDAGVLSTAKHFPGHGDTAQDSHGRLPKIDATKEVLFNRELVPFQALIDEGLPAIMTAHINYSSLVTQGEPATFSRKILNELLRGELSFNGIIITDDIMMTGATGYAGGLAVAVQKAIEAGNNLIESSKTPLLNEEVWLHNIKLMKTNEDFHFLVKSSAKRLLILKIEYFRGKNHVPIFPNIEEIPNALNNEDAKDFFVGMAARSVTIVRGMVEYVDEFLKDSLLIVSSNNLFLEAGKNRFKNARLSNFTECFEASRNAKTIIFCLDDYQALNIFQDLKATFPKKQYIIVSAMSPTLLQHMPEEKNVIAIYSNSPFSFMAAFSAIAGDFIPKGAMPLNYVK